MKYDEALKRWGAEKINTSLHKEYHVDYSEVTVELYANPGFVCCTEYDPGCYCSYAEEPSFQVVARSGRHEWYQMAEDFNFAGFLRELCRVADGTIEGL